MVSFRIDDEIVLREFESSDAEAVYAAVLKNYKHLKRYMHWIRRDYSLESAREFIAQSNAMRKDREGLSLGIFRSGGFIGSIGFVSFDWIAMKTEIGYWISQDEEGKGIISRSAKLLVDHAIRELKMNRIEIRCSADNIRSAAIPLRLGFTKEGLLRQAECRDGRLHDFVIFGLLASEWN